MRVTLDHVENVTSTIKTFWFKPEKPVRHTAGQYIELTLHHDKPDERGERRWFTLSASPSEPLVSISTRLRQGDEGSSFKRKLQALRPGDEVIMSQPMGDFVLPKDKTIPLVFIAGGIGITPMRSMVKWLYDTGEKRTVDLLYASNTLDEVAFRDLFENYGVNMKIILSEPPAGWPGETERLSGEKILELSPDDKRKLYYISGPEPMVETLVDQLKLLGLPESRLVTDYFPGYDSDAPSLFSPPQN
jgi:glycine betaine catabolism B